MPYGRTATIIIGTMISRVINTSPGAIPAIYKSENAATVVKKYDRGQCIDNRFTHPLPVADPRDAINPR